MLIKNDFGVDHIDKKTGKDVRHAGKEKHFNLRRPQKI